jgi:uncharacterized protein (DUF1499 family)
MNRIVKSFFNHSFLLGIMLILMVSSGCSGSRPDSIGVHDQRLSACPDSPNCVSSDAVDNEHRIAPFLLSGDAHEAWQKLIEIVDSMSRTTVIKQTDSYLHAECRSLVFRFVDDLELLRDPSAGTVSVRSASRLGHSDLGINRQRMESLRQILVKRGIIRE